MKTLKAWIIDEMISELKEMEGRTVYGCDLGFSIFESANVDGSYTYSTYEAINWIKKYFDDLGEIVEETTAEGLTPPNVFDKPESFMVFIMLECSSYLTGKCKFIEDNWNDEIELNKKNINRICKELKEIKKERYFSFYD